MQVSMTVNGKAIEAEADPRTTLVEFLRNQLHLTGTHIGCDTGQCGACTIHLDGRAVKSCSVLVGQAEGAAVTTIEGVANGTDDLHPVQTAFREHHGLQCGFCTPGMVMAAIDLLRNDPAPTEASIRQQLQGNYCRCTGYHNIVKAVQAAAVEMTATQTAPTPAKEQLA